MSFFLGFAVPFKAQARFREILDRYRPEIVRYIPEHEWHITLAWLGNIPLTAEFLSQISLAMPQMFLPTVRSLYVGRGRVPDQLWVYIEPAPLLLELRSQLLARLQTLAYPLPAESHEREYVPHIHVADLAQKKDAGTSVLFDTNASLTFAVQEITIWESSQTTQGVARREVSHIPLQTV